MEMYELNYKPFISTCWKIAVYTKVVSFNKFRGTYRARFGVVSVTLLSTYHLLRMKRPHCKLKCYKLFYYICWMKQEKMSACLFFLPIFFLHFEVTASRERAQLGQQNPNISFCS